MKKKKIGAFGAGQFSLGTLVGGRPSTTIFQNPGGGGGLGGVAYKDRAQPPPPPPRASQYLEMAFLEAEQHHGPSIQCIDFATVFEPKRLLLIPLETPKRLFGALVPEFIVADGRIHKLQNPNSTLGDPSLSPTPTKLIHIISIPDVT